MLAKQCQVRFILDFSASWPVNSFLISANYLFYAVTAFNLYFLNYLLMQLQFRKFSELFSYAATVFFLPELILHKKSVEGYLQYEHHSCSNERSLRETTYKRTMVGLELVGNHLQEKQQF